MTDMTALLTSVIETRRFSRLPVGLRRRAIRCLWHAQCLTGGSPDFGLGALFEDVLRVSGRAARQLQREVAFHDLMAASGWRALDRFGRGGFERDLASIAIPEAGTLARLAEAPRPIILAPLHMGAFALPLARMMRDHFGDRRLLILRAGAARGPETGAMQRIGELGIDWRTLDITDKQAYPDAVRFASGRAVIVSFCDLPGRFGSPQPVTLFGRRCALAAGLAALVRLTNAVAVPIAVHSTLGGDQVTLGPTFESHGGGDGE